MVWVSPREFAAEFGVVFNELWSPSFCDVLHPKKNTSNKISDLCIRRITSGFTGHERKTNHFTPARMSAPCATLCYPSPGYFVNNILAIRASEFEHVARIGRGGTIECVRFFVGHAGALVDQFRFYFREPNSSTRPHEGHIFATRRPFSGNRPVQLLRFASGVAYAISVWPRPGAPLSISLMSCISVSQSGQCVAS